MRKYGIKIIEEGKRTSIDMAEKRYGESLGQHGNWS
jgi:hypothetical protein